jgi:transposase
LKKLSDKNYLDLYFYDESHFGLLPVVPYAWQPKNQIICLPSFKSKYINVAGFYQNENDKKCYVVENKTINAKKLVEIFDNFAKTTTKKTVVVLDNAPIHKSKLFQSYIKYWEEEYDLYLFFLPPYSPELNDIEIYWKKIKYSLLPLNSYTNFQSLQNALFNIINPIFF